LPPDLTVTVPPGLPTGALPLEDPPEAGAPDDEAPGADVPVDAAPEVDVPDDEQPAAPSAAPTRTMQKTRRRVRMDHHHYLQSGHKVRQ
jgi:hypothetical protein